MICKIQGLYAIADNTFRPELTPAELAERFLEGGCRIVQLRMKAGMSFPRKRESRDPRFRGDDIGGGDDVIPAPPVGGGIQSDVFENALKIMALKKKYDFVFIVNDHVDIALEIGADGVHVGVDDMPVAEVREKVGDKMRIGYSSHSLKEAVAAEKAGADYVAFGAIFPTKTKGPGHPVQGLEKLRAVVKALTVPVIAIGGINKENFEQIYKTGVAAIAMITALTNAENIQAQTQYFAQRSSVFGPRSSVHHL